MSMKTGSKVRRKWNGNKVRSEVRKVFQKEVFVIGAELLEMFLHWHVMCRRAYLGQTLGKIRVEKDIKKTLLKYYES